MFCLVVVFGGGGGGGGVGGFRVYLGLGLGIHGLPGLTQ